MACLMALRGCQPLSGSHLRRVQERAAGVHRRTSARRFFLGRGDKRPAVTAPALLKARPWRLRAVLWRYVISVTLPPRFLNFCLFVRYWFFSPHIFQLPLMCFQITRTHSATELEAFLFSLPSAFCLGWLVSGKSIRW